MSCEVAALPFQVHANYGTWSIDFGFIMEIYLEGKRKIRSDISRLLSYFL